MHTHYHLDQKNTNPDSKLLKFLINAVNCMQLSWLVIKDLKYIHLNAVHSLTTDLIFFLAKCDYRSNMFLHKADNSLSSYNILENFTTPKVCWKTESSTTKLFATQIIKHT